MTISNSEAQVIRNVISKLRGHERQSEEVRAALTGPARLYLQSWIIPALELLLPEERAEHGEPDTRRALQLARDLSH